MKVLEIDDGLMVKTCEMHDHRYSIITPNDVVIPPDNAQVIIFEKIRWKNFLSTGNQFTEVCLNEKRACNDCG